MAFGAAAEAAVWQKRWQRAGEHARGSELLVLLRLFDAWCARAEAPQTLHSVGANAGVWFKIAVKGQPHVRQKHSFSVWSFQSDRVVFGPDPRPPWGQQTIKGPRAEGPRIFLGLSLFLIQLRSYSPWIPEWPTSRGWQKKLPPTQNPPPTHNPTEATKGQFTSPFCIEPKG